MAESASNRKKSAAWLVPATLGAGALALSLVTGSLGAYTASITNSANTAGAGGLTMQETGPGASGTDVTCNSTDGNENNAATCSNINKYGGKTAMAPGDKSTVNISLKNTGTINAKAASLTAGACVQTPAAGGTTGDLCDTMTVRITSGGTEIFSGTPKALAAKGAIDLKSTPAAGATTPYTIETTLPLTATNAVAGAAISQLLTWTYTA